MLYKSDSEHAVQMMHDDPNMFQEVSPLANLKPRADEELVSYRVPSPSASLAIKPSIILCVKAGVLSNQNSHS